MHTVADSAHVCVALVGWDQVEFVDEDQGGHCIAKRWDAALIDGGKMFARIDHVDDATEAKTTSAPAGDQAGQGEWFGETAGFNHDRVEFVFGCGHSGEGVLEATGIGEATDAAARNGDWFVDLIADQPGVDVEFTKVVDNHSHSRAGVTEQVVQHAGFAGAQVAGQQDHRDGRAHVGEVRAGRRGGWGFGEGAGRGVGWGGVCRGAGWRAGVGAVAVVRVRHAIQGNESLARGLPGAVMGHAWR